MITMSLWFVFAKVRLCVLTVTNVGPVAISASR